MAACDAMGLDDELNAVLGHGFRTIHNSATGQESWGDGSDGAIGIGCSFYIHPDDVVQLPGWRDTWGQVGVIFDFINSNGVYPREDFPFISWDAYLQILGGERQDLPGYGRAAAIYDNLDTINVYSVVVQGQDGGIVRMTTLYPEALRAEQISVNNLMLEWVDGALAGAATVQP